VEFRLSVFYLESRKFSPLVTDVLGVQGRGDRRSGAEKPKVRMSLNVPPEMNVRAKDGKIPLLLSRGPRGFLRTPARRRCTCCALGNAGSRDGTFDTRQIGSILSAGARERLQGAH
jgi:hypothetical protein